MIRTAWVLGLAALAAGCAAGPSYHPEQPIPPATRVGTARSSDSVAAFFDSLATARSRDSAVAGAVPPVPERSLRPDSAAALAWLDLFHDSTLVNLVRTALEQNRDLRTAVGRIHEFRAEVGVARSPLFPELSVNGSVSTNQVAIGSFPPTSYDAYRLTGDVAWELDFWGRTRRGIEAARADLASEEASERAVVLSLVSDVASGYLSLLELDQERAIAERTLASRQATLALARQRFEQGLTSELDVRQFEAQVAVPAATLAQTERAHPPARRARGRACLRGRHRAHRRGAGIAPAHDLDHGVVRHPGLLGRRPVQVEHRDLSGAGRGVRAAVYRRAVVEREAGGGGTGGAGAEPVRAERAGGAQGSERRAGGRAHGPR
jgi:hypothetical protein